MNTLIAGIVFAAVVVAIVYFVRKRAKKLDVAKPPVGSGGTSGPKPESQ